jgi:hypothetical protein
MAHFARLDSNNKVLNVLVISNKDILDENGLENEQKGIAFCHKLYDKESPNCNYKQTSYNTKGRKYYNTDNTLSSDQSKAFRGNYAEIGGTYDPSLDAFIPAKKYTSWVFEQDTYTYIPPIPKPETYGHWKWNITNFTTGEGFWVDNLL